MDDKNNDRPATEPKFQITPEMIAAGSRELLRWDERVDTRESAARAVFLAMWEESRRAAGSEPL
jgi:hypothetical protein